MADYTKGFLDLLQSAMHVTVEPWVWVSRRNRLRISKEGCFEPCCSEMGKHFLPHMYLVFSEARFESKQCSWGLQRGGPCSV